MRYGDYHVPLGMFEGVMIAAYAIRRPPVILQHSDQLATISFHLTTSSRAAGKSCRVVARSAVAMIGR
jgi:hypothetical protein